MQNHTKEAIGRKYVPTGIKVKSAILFSIFLTILSRPLARKVPELVRTLNVKGIYIGKVHHQRSVRGSLNKQKISIFNIKLKGHFIEK